MGVIINRLKHNKMNFPKIKQSMKTVLSFFATEQGLLILVCAVLAIMAAAAGGCESHHLACAAILAGTAGGKHVVDGPLTLDLTEEASPGLLRNEIDERIVRIRPMSTPIDQISRQAGARMCGSMVVDYYSVDTKPVASRIEIECAGSSGKAVNGFTSAVINTENDLMFEPSETIMVPDVKVETADGQTGTLVLYVVSRDNDGLRVVSVNAVNERGEYAVPLIPAGSSIVRMGRAAAELDVQTAQFEALPTKSRNYCQIFKAQVEQSTYQKIANKEVGWTFSDQEEAAIVDMRLGMEKNFLFGYRNRVYDPVKQNEIMLTGGIWHQAGRDAEYPKDGLTLDRIIEISRTAFTGNGGSSKKLLIGGTMLIEALNKLEHTKVVGASETMTRWGLDFTEVVTKFGRLYVLASEVFDQCGHEYDGMIIDPEYITKYCHVPFRTERLDLRSSGVRNTDAIVITEASCLVLRYPDAHMRIVGK